MIYQCKLMFSKKYHLWTPFLTKWSECDVDWISLDSLVILLLCLIQLDILVVEPGIMEYIFCTTGYNGMQVSSREHEYILVDILHLWPGWLSAIYQLDLSRLSPVDGWEVLISITDTSTFVWNYHMVLKLELLFV